MVQNRKGKKQKRNVAGVESFVFWCCAWSVENWTVACSLVANRLPKNIGAEGGGVEGGGWLWRYSLVGWRKAQRWPLCSAVGAAACCFARLPLYLRKVFFRLLEENTQNQHLKGSSGAMMRHLTETYSILSLSELFADSLEQLLHF